MAVRSGRVGRARTRVTAAGLLAGLALTGCASASHIGHLASTGRSAPVSAVTSRQPVAPNGAPLGKVSTPGTPKGEQTVPLVVVATRGAQKRTTFALIPVYIDGQGPFPFALDTGASRSLIAAALARRLHLPDRGSAGELYGIVGGASAENVMVSDWRAGSVKLPSEIVATLGSASGSAVPPPAQGKRGQGPLGLLGSDVLSRYGKIAVDYDKSFLILDPPVK